MSRLRDWISRTFGRQDSGLRYTVPRGRQTQATWQTAYSLAQGYVSSISRTLPRELYTLMEQLWLALPDFSKAVANNVRLANTGYRLVARGGSEQRQAEILTECNRLAESAYVFDGGLDGFVVKAFQQISIKGAICAEPVAKRDLSGIDYVTPLPVEDILFEPDRRGGRPRPFQSPLYSFNDKTRTLDPDWFIYLPVATTSDKPYGIPPAVSGLEAFSRQISIFGHLTEYLARINILGLMALPVKAPVQNRNESAAAYHARVKEYTEQVLAVGLDAAKKGAIAYAWEDGFPPPVVQSTTTSASGVKDIAEHHDPQIAAAVGQDPSMLGRNYSVSETHIRFHYYTHRQQLMILQRLVKRALEKIYRLHLSLLGVDDVTIKVQWNAPKDLTAKEEAETEALRYDTWRKMYLDGLISKTELAQEFGFDEPENDEPAWPERQAEIQNNAFAGFSAELVAELAKKKPGTSVSASARRRQSFAESAGSELNRRVRELLGEIDPALAEADGLAAAAAVGIVARSLDAKDFAERATSVISDSYTDRLLRSDVYTPLINGSESAYAAFRLDGRPLLGEAAPDWTAIDDRVSKALSERPAYYVGRLAQSEAAQKQVRDYLEKEFIDRGLNSADKKALDLFREELKGQLGEISRHRAHLIVQTGVHDIQINAHIRQMYEDGVEHLVVVSRLSDRTCDVCRKMHGTKIALKVEHRRLEEDLTLTPDEFKQKRDWAPLRDSSYTPEQAVADGRGTPPFHGDCECVIQKAP